MRMAAGRPDALATPWPVAARARPSGRLVRFARRYPVAVAGAAFLVVLTLAAAFAPWIAPYHPLANDYMAMFSPPSAKHWLGTDSFGRDILSRLVFGARTALLVGLTSSLVGATVGAVVGVASAYFGGTVDLVVQRITDILVSFPLIVLAMAMVAILGTGTTNLILAIALSFAPRAELVVRSSALQVRQMTYVEAARAVGAGPWRIIFRHMLPNVLAPYLVMLTAFLGQAILLEASLSFLGLGVAEPTPAWGLMLSGAAVDFVQRAPWMAVSPGLAITLTVLAFNVFGDALRDALDPKLRV